MGWQILKRSINGSQINSDLFALPKYSFEDYEEPQPEEYETYAFVISKRNELVVDLTQDLTENVDHYEERINQIAKKLTIQEITDIVKKSSKKKKSSDRKCSIF